VISSKSGRPFSQTSRPVIKVSQLSLTRIAGGKMSRKMRPNPARSTTRMYSSSMMRRTRLGRFSGVSYATSDPGPAGVRSSVRSIGVSVRLMR
jgi:hypothetical protein